MKLKLTQQIIIGQKHENYASLDRLCWLSKNLYNQALYQIRLQYSKDKTYLGYSKLYRLLYDTKQPDYFASQRLDNWTNVIMFKPVETKNIADRVRDELLDEYEEKENIENVQDFEDAFTETLIKLCKGNSEHYIKKLKK